MTKKTAGIYKRKDALYIRASVRTEDDLWLEDGPCTRLDVTASPSEIGDALLEALSRSGRVVPHPTEWKSVDEDNPILQAAGIKRWSTFRKGSWCLSISLREELSLIPTVNEGSDGFGHLPDDAVRLPTTATALEVGEAVQQALSRCR